MENIEKIKSIIEALLIVSDQGLSREQLKEAITDSSPKEIEEGVTLLKEDYNSPHRAFNIAEIAGKCRIVTKPEFMPWIANLYEKDVDRLTVPSLETLAIVAYKQPATRAEVEAVRGVNVGGVLKTLLDKDLLKVRGRKEVIGRPLMYGTTDKFLEIFGLNSLDDLPVLRDFSEEDLEYGKPQETVEVEPDQQASHEEGAQKPEEDAETQENERQDTEDSLEEIPEAPSYKEKEEGMRDETAEEDKAEKEEAETIEEAPKETEPQEEARQDVEDTEDQMPLSENIETEKEEVEAQGEEREEKKIESSEEADKPEIKESDNEFQKTE